MSIAPTHESRGLEIRLFGGFEMSRSAAPLPPTRTRSSQWLLALLILRRDREWERAALAGTLWPDSGESQGLYNLRRSLSELRHALGEDACRLTAPTPRRIALDVSDAFVDVLEFERAAGQTESAALEMAVSLYRGPLLDGCFEEWILPERNRCERAFLTALESLAEQRMAQRNYLDAMEYLRRTLACDPLREIAVRLLMQSLAESGDTVGAIAAYREFRLRLHADLRLEPDAETTALYQRVRGTDRQQEQSSKFDNRISAQRPIPNTQRLPHPLTPLIGREAEIADLKDCLAASRLVTLVGPGGVGKTRLSVALAPQVAEDYEDGVYFLDLAPLTDPAQVSYQAATLLNAPVEREKETIDALCRFLAPKSLLLILDNCEHLIEACAELAETVLRRCPNVRILAASRQTLRICGERSLSLLGLPLPQDDKSASYPGIAEPEWEKFAGSDAVRLFVQAATAANSTFRLTPENVGDVAAICRLLDGLPFAIELAAAWVKSLPVTQIAARLDNRFELLIGVGRAARPGQQTLRATLDWSYDLLSEEEAALLRRLAVFSGGWTLESAEAMTGSRQLAIGSRADADGGKAHPAALRIDTTADSRLPTAASIVLLLRQLVDKSLTVYEEWEGTARYRLLETTREYAREQWTPAESALYRRAHACHFFEWARRARENIDVPGAGPEGRSRLSAERDNLRSALLWWRNEDLPSGATLLLWLYEFGLMPYHSQEARAWVTCLQEANLPDSPSFAFLYLAVGEWADWQGSPSAAVMLWEKSREMATRCDDRQGMAAALLSLGCNAIARKDYTRAESCLRDSQTYFEAIGNDGKAAEARNRRGLLNHFRGEKKEARRLLEKSLAVGRDRGDKTMIADALDMLGYAAWKDRDYTAAAGYFCDQAELLEADSNHFTANALRHLGAVKAAHGDYASAESHLEEARCINRRIGFLPGEGWDCYYRADVAHQQDKGDEAWGHLGESLRIFEAIGESGSVLVCLRRWAQFEEAAGRWARAVCLWSHTERQGETDKGSVETYMFAEADNDMASALVSCRAHLSERRFQEAWAEGQSLTPERAGEYARSGLPK